MKKELFGHLHDGTPVFLYTLKNTRMELRVLDYGCRLQALIFNGRDLVCGHDNMEDYLADTSCQGALVGRVANRIKDAHFTLNGKEYQLKKNHRGRNHLHGILTSLIWNVAEISDDCIVFTHTSPPEEEGYPGTVAVTVIYRLLEDCLVMDYTASTDEDTPINLTNHTYFNVDGYDACSVREHELCVSGDRISVVDEDLIPVGEYLEVADTPYDFREFHKIGERLNDDIKGYDNNYFITRDEPVSVAGYEGLYHAATVRSSHNIFSCYTNLPCIQIYTANFLGNGPVFKSGIPPRAQHSICLETQFEPDSVNRGKGILRPGDTYHAVTVYRLTER